MEADGNRYSNPCRSREKHRYGNEPQRTQRTQRKRIKRREKVSQMIYDCYKWSLNRRGNAIHKHHIPYSPLPTPYSL